LVLPLGAPRFNRDFRDFVVFLRTSARLANVAARFETIKNPSAIRSPRPALSFFCP